MDNPTQTVIIGAGIAGIAAAYYLSRQSSGRRILLIERSKPMAYTTSKSGENFRDYWPQRCMARFSSRSLALMQSLADESAGAIKLVQSGYDCVSQRVDGDLFSAARDGESGNQPTLERYTDPELLRRQFPYLAHATQQVVRIRRAGSVDVHALGSAMLTLARRRGVKTLSAEVQKIEHVPPGFCLQLGGQDGQISCRELVLCAGPMTPALAGQLGIKLDALSYLQRKFIMPDPLRAVPRDMPFTIYADTQHLEWSDEERTLISGDPDYSWLLDEFPPGLHIKPEAGGRIKLGWAFNREPGEPAWEPADDFDFPNITLRGAARMIPALKPYLEQLPTPLIQYSGYYSRTPENWPIIGPLGEQEGLYTIAALSGFGTMTACAAGELLVQYMTGSALPDYARHFHPRRREDPEILAEINSMDSDGQL